MSEVAVPGAPRRRVSRRPRGLECARIPKGAGTFCSATASFGPRSRGNPHHRACAKALAACRNGDTFVVNNSIDSPDPSPKPGLDGVTRWGVATVDTATVGGRLSWSSSYDSPELKASSSELKRPGSSRKDECPMPS